MALQSEKDCIYFDVPVERPINIKEHDKVRVSIERKNLQDIVVWNPWDYNSSQLSDWGPKDGYTKMVCVESGTVHKYIHLLPNQSWTGYQHIIPKF